jgi:hypothetical protein
MGWGMRLAPLSLAVAAALAAPSAAQAPTIYVGETSQGRLAKVVAAPDGTVERIRINYRALCRKRGYYITQRAAFTPPLDDNGNPFSDEGKFTESLKRSKAHFIARVRGRFSADRSMVSGRARFTARLRRKGRLIDYCKTPRLRFEALRR